MTDRRSAPAVPAATSQPLVDSYFFVTLAIYLVSCVRLSSFLGYQPPNARCTSTYHVVIGKLVQLSYIDVSDDGQCA